MARQVSIETLKEGLAALKAAQPAPAAPAPADHFILDTTPAASRRRGEEILGLSKRPAGDIWSAVVRVKPSQAKSILIAMPSQRQLEASTVHMFVELIKNKEFTVTHQGLAFDPNGLLFDGQHRLEACIVAAVPVDIMATFNCPRSTFSKIDRGRTRTIGDDLTCEALVVGKLNSNMMAAGAKVLYMLDTGRVPYSTFPRGMFSPSKVMGVIHAHPGLHDATTYCVAHKAQLRGLGPGAMCGFLTKFSEINRDRAYAFFDRLTAGHLADGTGLPAGDPAGALREFTRHSSGARFKIVRSPAMVALVKAWNAEIRNRPIHKITAVIRDGSSFPEILTG